MFTKDINEKQRIKRRNLFIFITILWACFIFSFSLQPAEISSEMSGGVGRWIVENLFPWYVGRLESMSQEMLDFLHTLLRKCAHFSEYFVLGILSTMTMFQTKRQHKKTTSLVLCALVASVDETIQLFVSGRSGQLSDVLLDSTGALVAIVLTAAIFYMMDRRRRENKPEGE